MRPGFRIGDPAFAFPRINPLNPEPTAAPRNATFEFPGINPMNREASRISSPTGMSNRRSPTPASHPLHDVHTRAPDDGVDRLRRRHGHGARTSALPLLGS